MTKADGTRIITPTDEPPVRIKEDNWPTVAQGDIGDIGSLRVRHHESDDRKIIVYATLTLEDGTAKAGRMLDLSNAVRDVPATVRQVEADLIARTQENLHRQIRLAAD